MYVFFYCSAYICDAIEYVHVFFNYLLTLAQHYSSRSL